VEAGASQILLVVLHKVFTLSLVLLVVECDDALCQSLVVVRFGWSIRSLV